jgi:D-serine deaminase-like pyridoxal phosphate-dependent protein
MTDYFNALNRALQQASFALPTLIIDQARLDANLAQVKQLLPKTTRPRLVVKSLGALPLLHYLADALHCNNFMVFHQPHLALILDSFADADILLGKPMPVQAVRQFYTEHPTHASAPIQWLTDSLPRLQQYLAYAQSANLRLAINIEIDVGLHRGGIQTLSQFKALLALIAQHPQHLQLRGLMGYDAHVGKLPAIIQSVADSYAQSQQTYQSYIDTLQHDFASLYHAGLCFNGSGSPTFSLHAEHTVCNDLSFGSMLLKPTDFNLPTLSRFQPALWIATPVLKKMPATHLPGLPPLDKVPFRAQALFVYGGKWMADYVYPTGAAPNPLYGRSTNQEMVNVPRGAKIEVDDFVFLCPHQSEAVINQFAQVWLYSSDAVAPDFRPWPTFQG